MATCGSSQWARREGLPDRLAVSVRPFLVRGSGLDLPKFIILRESLTRLPPVLGGTMCHTGDAGANR
jgi:hypothetical protein